MNIETERLLIREIEESDYPDILEYGCDKETGQYMSRWPKSPVEIKAFLSERVLMMKSRSPEKYNLAVCLKKENKVIGHITVNVKDEETLEIGWILNKAYWRRGNMSEAASLAIEHFIPLWEERE